MIFDTHAHYEDRQFDRDREALLASFAGHGIRRVVNVSASWDSLEKTKKLTEKYDWVYGAYGLHPEEIAPVLGMAESDDVPENQESETASQAEQEAAAVVPVLTEEELYEQLRGYCRFPKAVAVGEIGLDYYWEKDPEKKELQKTWFRRQLQLARELQLPVNIHSRDAAEDTLRIAKEEKLGEIGGIMHCYSYSVEMAREYLNMDLYLGIGGVVTFKNARKLKETVAYAPLSRLVLETDCPYLAPVPHRGKRNCSLYLPLVVQAIAEIKGITAEEAETVTWENACRVYGLDKDL